MKNLFVLLASVVCVSFLSPSAHAMGKSIQHENCNVYSFGTTSKGINGESSTSAGASDPARFDQILLDKGYHPIPLADKITVDNTAQVGDLSIGWDSDSETVLEKKTTSYCSSSYSLEMLSANGWTVLASDSTKSCDLLSVLNSIPKCKTGQ